MAPGSAAGRVWLPLFLLLTILVVVVWPADDDAPSKPPGTPIAEENLPLAAAPLQAQPMEASAEVERKELSSEELGGLDPEVPPEQQLAVRVWISTQEEDRPVVPPKDAEEWTAVAQTWLRDTNETFRFEVPFTRQGVASFIFLEDTHVDWVAAVPPKSSKYGMMTYEGHDEYQPGDQGRHFFTLGPGGTLTGRVIDHLGNPIGGVPLDLMHGEGASLDFTPGFTTVFSQNDGRFEFGPLQSDRLWTVAVPPGDYLMLKPTYEQNSGGHGAGHIPRNGGTVSVGTLQVMPGSTVTLDVLDSQGVGVPAVYVSVEPLRYEGSFLRQPLHPDSQKEFKIDLLSSDSTSAQKRKHREAQEAREKQARIGHEDPYVDSYAFRTNRAGRTQLHLPPGEYRLHLGNYPGQGEDDDLTLDFSTRQPHLYMTIPSTLGTIRGRLLDETDQPMPYARLWLGSSDDDYSARTNGQGVFEIEKLPIDDAEYSLRVVETGTYPVLAGHEWHPVPSILEGVTDYRVQRGFELPITVLTAQGNQPPKGRLRLLGWEPLPGAPPPQNLQWFDLVRQENGLNKSGATTFTNLLPGMVEVALLLPFGTGEFEADGRAKVTWQMHQRWLVPVDGSRQSLTADLSGYSEPVAQQTKHSVQVLNQVTGESVGPARIRLAMTEPYYQRGSTSSGGRFFLDMRRGQVEVEIVAAGYRPWVGTWLETSADAVEHEVHMIPEDSRVVIELRDRDGAQIPNGPITLEDRNGVAIRADVNPGRRYPRLRTTASLNNGQLSLAMVPVGTLILRAPNFGADVAVARIEIPAAPAGKVLHATMDWSLAEWQSALEQGYQR